MIDKDPLRELIADGHSATSDFTASRWLQRADAFVTVVLDVEDIELFHSLTSQGDEFERVACALGFLEGLVHKTEKANTASTPNRRTTEFDATNSTTVFIVHGHDSATKEQAARFLEKLAST